MQFYEEDGIIFATSALIIANLRVDDSIVREFIREVMSKIRRSSGYGYTEATIFPRPRPFDLAAIEILKNMGYWVIEKTMDNFDRTNKEHALHILWKEPTTEEMVSWKVYGIVHCPIKETV